MVVISEMKKTMHEENTGNTVNFGGAGNQTQVKWLQHSHPEALSATTSERG